MRPSSARAWLAGSFFVECCCAGLGLLWWRHGNINSVLYVLSGLGLVCATVYLPPPLPMQKTVRTLPALRLAMAAAIVFVVAWTGYERFWSIPLDPDYADMLPIMKVMNERFLAGHWHQVYDTIPDIWGGIKPIYLPAMWLPYAPAVLAHFDLRWISAASLAACFLVFVWVSPLQRRISSGIVLAGTALLFVWLTGFEDRHGLLSLTEEGVVMGWFMLLALALASGNAVAIGLAAAACGLSRYALIGWLPAYLLWLLLGKRFRAAFAFCATGLAAVLFGMILPFGFEAFRNLLELPSDYVDFAGRVWSDSPETFWTSPGLARFFGPGGTALLHRLLVTASFAAPILFVVLARWRKWNNVPLAALKLALVVFYSLVDVPYLYLFYTSSAVSLVMVARLLPAETGRPATL